MLPPPNSSCPPDSARGHPSCLVIHSGDPSAWSVALSWFMTPSTNPKPGSIMNIRVYSSIATVLEDKFGQGQTVPAGLREQRAGVCTVSWLGVPSFRLQVLGRIYCKYLLQLCLALALMASQSLAFVVAKEWYLHLFSFHPECLNNLCLWEDWCGMRTAG